MKSTRRSTLKPCAYLVDYGWGHVDNGCKGKTKNPQFTRFLLPPRIEYAPIFPGSSLRDIICETEFSPRYVRLRLCPWCASTSLSCCTRARNRIWTWTAFTKKSTLGLNAWRTRELRLEKRAPCLKQRRACYNGTRYEHVFPKRLIALLKVIIRRVRCDYVKVRGVRSRPVVVRSTTDE